MTTEIEILQYLHYNPLAKRSEILPSLSKQDSNRTLMRMLSETTAKEHIQVVGCEPTTRYRLTPQAHVTMELNLKDLTVVCIEEIHALLTKELGVVRNIRHRRVGIT